MIEFVKTFINPIDECIATGDIANRFFFFFFFKLISRLKLINAIRDENENRGSTDNLIDFFDISLFRGLFARLMKRSLYQ